jgi:hypothetical protein
MNVNLACYHEEIRQSKNFRNKVLRAAERLTKEVQTRNEHISLLLQIFLTLDKKKLHRANAGGQPCPKQMVRYDLKGRKVRVGLENN